MQLTSSSFLPNQAIPAQYAFGKLADDGPMALSDNQNPELNWCDVPEGTLSLVLLCIDSDVPTVMADVNQADCSIPNDQPRRDFVHWVMVDIPPSLNGVSAGSCSNGVVTGGKSNPSGPDGTRQGINDYTGFMGDGDYYGYDGPCPPWNDLRLHHYHFRLYALDVAKLPLTEQRFTAAQVLSAMAGHVLAEAEVSGTYSLNPEVLKTVA